MDSSFVLVAETTWLGGWAVGGLGCRGLDLLKGVGGASSPKKQIGEYANESTGEPCFRFEVPFGSLRGCKDVQRPGPVDSAPFLSWSSLPFKITEQNGGPLCYDYRRSGLNRGSSWVVLCFGGSKQLEVLVTGSTIFDIHMPPKNQK